MDMSLNPIRSMEPLLLKRLRLVFPVKTFQMERVAPVMDAAEFERLTRQTPYIGLAFNGFRNDAQAGRFVQGLWNWKLIIVCKAVGSFNRRVKGDKFDVGLDDIMDVASVILHGVSLDEIGLVSVTSSDVVYSQGWGNQAIVLAHLDFNVRTNMASGDLKLETPQDFKGINAIWLSGDENQEA